MEIADLVRKLEKTRNDLPLTASAEDLLMAGHITHEEYDFIRKGEVAERLLKQEPFDDQSVDIQLSDLITGPFQSIKIACDMVDSAIEQWFPKQINHTLIRVKRSSKIQHSLSNLLTIQVDFTLLDIDKKLKRQLRTDIGVDIEELCYLDEKGSNKIYWDHFQATLINQFQNIILQILYRVNTESFEDKKDYVEESNLNKSGGFNHD